jgi:hypothetical protein
MDLNDIPLTVRTASGWYLPRPTLMGVKTGDPKSDATGGLLGILTPEQDRRLRAMAWRYVRRIDSETARRMWRIARNRDLARAA